MKIKTNKIYENQQRLRSTNPLNRYGNPITFRPLQVTPLTNGTKTTASKVDKAQRPVGGESEEKRRPAKEEEVEHTAKTVFKVEKNIWTIRCYIYRLKFKFIIVIYVYSYVVYASTSRKSGNCDITLYYVLNCICAINSNTDILVPVNSTTV